jgi:hypothetical protein
LAIILILIIFPLLFMSMGLMPIGKARTRSRNRASERPTDQRD